MNTSCEQACTWARSETTDGKDSSLEGLSRNDTRAGNLSNYLVLDLGELIFDIPEVRSAFIVIYSVTFFFCFFGNLAVVLVVTLHWRMRSVTKFFLGNLAFANLCVGVFCVYQNLSTYLMDSWPFGAFLCKMYHFIDSLSHTASILILVVISIERYAVLLHPFKYRRTLTIQRLRMIIVGVWGVSGLLSAPRLYYIDVILIPIRQGPGEPPTSDMICAPRQSIYDNKAMDIVNFVMQFLLPMGIITVMYTRIALFLRQCDRLQLSTNAINGRTSSLPSSNTEDIRLSSFPRGNGSNGVGSSLLRHLTRNGNGPREPEISILSTTSTSGYTYQEYSESEKELCRISVAKSCSSDDRSSSKGKGRWKVRFSKGADSSHSQSSRSALNRSSSASSSLDCVPSGCVGGRVGSHTSLQTASGVPPSHRIQNQLMGDTGRMRLGVKEKLSRVKKRTRRTAVRMLIVIVVSFAICNLPFHVRKMCQNYVENYDLTSDLSHVFTMITFLLMYLNCAINPILYAFLSKSFRASFKDLMRCRWRRKVLTGRPVLS